MRVELDDDAVKKRLLKGKKPMATDLLVGLGHVLQRPELLEKCLAIRHDRDPERILGREPDRNASRSDFVRGQRSHRRGQQQ